MEKKSVRQKSELHILNKMNLIQSQSNIIEKVLRDKEGRLVRARFQVYEVAGRVKARLIDFSYIESLKGSVLSLSNYINEKAVRFVQTFDKTFVSPFFGTTALALSGSKPRAPTF